MLDLGARDAAAATLNAGERRLRSCLDIEGGTCPPTTTEGSIRERSDVVDSSGHGDPEPLGPPLFTTARGNPVEAYLGQIMLFAGPYAPSGWAFCDGQMLSITQNSALFAVLGIQFGGDGRSTFALPDLRGRVPLHVGGSQGPGQPTYTPGQKGGNTSVTLQTAQLPPHNHNLAGDNSNATVANPSGGNLAQPNDGNSPPSTGAGYTTGTPANPVTLSGSAISNTGGGQPVPTMPPFTAINYIIALQGIFPSRS